MNAESPGNAGVRTPVDEAALHHKGLRSLEQGQLDTAVRLLEAAARAQPDSAPVRNDLGIALGSLGRLDQASAVFRAACAIDPTHADARFNLGCALRALDRPDEAIAAFRDAIAADPALDDARIELAGLLRELGRAADAVECLEGTSGAGLERAEVQLERARALADAGDTRAAESAFRHCLEIAPDLAAAHTALGALLKDERRFGEALACFEWAVTLRPDLAESHFNLGAALLANGDPRAAHAALGRSLAIAPGATRALALETIALSELRAHAEVRELAGFERFVCSAEIDVPAGFADLEAYNAALAAHVLAHPTLARDPGRHATRNGAHSGNLLAEPKGPVAALEETIKQAVLDYVRALPRGSGHPFVAVAPRRMGMEAWGIVLGASGHQISHIHPGAWLSGVYYVRVPRVVDAEGDHRPGWFEFSCSHPNYPTTVEPHAMPVKPREGLLILFPSYLYHRTVPFESRETRLSIAFDIYPEEG